MRQNVLHTHCSFHASRYLSTSQPFLRIAVGSSWLRDETQQHARKLGDKPIAGSIS